MHFLQRVLRFSYAIKRVQGRPGKQSPALSAGEVQQNKIAYRGPVMLNQQINQCTSQPKLKQILKDKGQYFNLINMSTYLKNYSELPNRDEQLTKQITELFVNKLSGSLVVQEGNSRALANSLFYLSRMADDKELQPVIQRLTDLDLQKLMELSNSKETMMVVNSLFRFGMRERVELLLPALRQKLVEESFSSTHLVMIWMALLKHELSDSDMDRLMDQLLKDRKAQTIADYSDLLYCYSKCDRKLVDSYVCQWLSNYPRSDIFNMRVEDMTTITYALGTFREFKADENFFKVLVTKAHQFLKHANSRTTANMVHGLMVHGKVDAQLLAEFQAKLDTLVDFQKSVPIDLESVTSIVLDLVRHESHSQQLVEAIERFLIGCVLPQNQHKFSSAISPRFVFRLIKALNIHQQTQHSYTVKLDLSSAVQSYIIKVIAQLKADELAQSIMSCSTLISSEQLCWAFIKAANNLANSEDDNVNKVMNRNCISGKLRCLGCRDSLARHNQQPK